MVYILSLISGVLFGSWPYSLNKVSLSPYDSPAVMSLVQGALLASGSIFFQWNRIEYRSGKVFTATLIVVLVINWFCRFRYDMGSMAFFRSPIFLASLMSGAGVICLTKVMKITPPAEHATFLTLISCVQVVTFLANYLIPRWPKTLDKDQVFALISVVAFIFVIAFSIAGLYKYVPRIISAD